MRKFVPESASARPVALFCLFLLQGTLFRGSALRRSDHPWRGSSSSTTTTEGKRLYSDVARSVPPAAHPSVGAAEVERAGGLLPERRGPARLPGRGGDEEEREGEGGAAEEEERRTDRESTPAEQATPLRLHPRTRVLRMRMGSREDFEGKVKQEIFFEELVLDAEESEGPSEGRGASAATGVWRDEHGRPLRGWRLCAADLAALHAPRPGNHTGDTEARAPATAGAPRFSWR